MMKQNCNSQQFHEIFRKFQKSTSFFFSFCKATYYAYNKLLLHTYYYYYYLVSLRNLSEFK